MPRLTRWLLFRRFFLPIAMFIALLIIGTIGYVIIDNYTVLNALYMTVITIATVGFGETEPLSDMGKVFTIILIIASIAVVAFYITMITRLLLEGEWRKQYQIYRQGKKLEQMKNHVIVCGYGRNGTEACKVLKQNNVPYVVIEQRQNYLDDIHETNIPVVQGDATKDESLLEAGLLKAKALISALPNDSDNLFIVLTARQLNPSLIIISRASDDHTISKLKIAGASNVIMPDKLGGSHMASLALIPDVHELLSLITTKHNDEFKISELQVFETVALGELDLWRMTGCTSLGIKKLDNTYIPNPQPEDFLQPNERLIVMGSSAMIEKARAYLKN